MISMMIFCPSEKETGYLCICSKDAVGGMSDEKLEIVKCQTIDTLKKVITLNEKIDLACIDITVLDTLELVEIFRKKNEKAYIVLISNAQISPVTYMKPSIHAESLILKPFSKQQVDNTVKEVFREIIKKYSSPVQEGIFVVDDQNGRIMFEYSAICFFEARNKKIYLNTGAKEYGFYSTMEQLEQELSTSFIRCHRSFIVNVEKIEKVMFSKNLLFLTDGYEIPVSRTYKSVLRPLWKNDNEIKALEVEL